MTEEKIGDIYRFEVADRLGDKFSIHKNFALSGFIKYHFLNSCLIFIYVLWLVSPSCLLLYS